MQSALSLHLKFDMSRCRQDSSSLTTSPMPVLIQLDGNLSESFTAHDRIVNRENLKVLGVESGDF